MMWEMSQPTNINRNNQNSFLDARVQIIDQEHLRKLAAIFNCRHLENQLQTLTFPEIETILYVGTKPEMP